MRGGRKKRREVGDGGSSEGWRASCVQGWYSINPSIDEATEVQ